jgi:hypothetical protein
MTVVNQPKHRSAQDFADELVQLAREGADSQQIAVRVVLKWRDLEDALSPIIGHGGVSALFRRAVFLTRHAHPSLSSLQDLADQTQDFAVFQAFLSEQPSLEAAAIASALQQKFIDLLAHLIGDTLTERLLRSVWDNTSSDKGIQDTSQ